MKTLVLGASDNTERYSNQAIRALRSHGHEVLAVGRRHSRVEDVEINTGQPFFSGVHTITLYLSASHQQALHDYILSLHPKRIIFNPGAENPALASLAAAQGIDCQEACTLVLLATGQFGPAKA